MPGTLAWQRPFSLKPGSYLWRRPSATIYRDARAGNTCHRRWHALTRLRSMNAPASSLTFASGWAKITLSSNDVTDLCCMWLSKNVAHACCKAKQLLLRWMYVCMYVRMCMYVCVRACVRARTNERESERTNERESERTRERTNEWRTNEWMKAGVRWTCAHVCISMACAYMHVYILYTYELYVHGAV